MPWFEIEFEYTGNAPTKSSTESFCIENLEYGKENVKSVSPVRVLIEGSSLQNILDYINHELKTKNKRSGTVYIKAVKAE